MHLIIIFESKWGKFKQIPILGKFQNGMEIHERRKAKEIREIEFGDKLKYLRIIPNVINPNPDPCEHSMCTKTVAIEYSKESSEKGSSSSVQCRL